MAKIGQYFLERDEKVTQLQYLEEQLSIMESHDLEETEDYLAVYSQYEKLNASMDTMWQNI